MAKFEAMNSTRIPRTMLVINLSVRPDDFISPGFGDATIRLPIPNGHLPETLDQEIAGAIADLINRPSVQAAMVDALDD